jgi:hypothetical protein
MNGEGLTRIFVDVILILVGWKIGKRRNRAFAGKNRKIFVGSQ